MYSRGMFTGDPKKFGDANSIPQEVLAEHESARSTNHSFNGGATLPTCAHWAVVRFAKMQKTIDELTARLDAAESARSKRQVA